jgi:hypothetical protein
MYFCLLCMSLPSTIHVVELRNPHLNVIFLLFEHVVSRLFEVLTPNFIITLHVAQLSENMVLDKACCAEH